MANLEMDGCRYIWPVDKMRQWIEVEGLKQWEVGEKLGVSYKLVGKACKRYGIKCQRRGPRGGHLHPDWKGGRMIDKDGYVMVYTPGHPHARKPVPYVREHRLVMEQHLGRYLTRQEVVHHKNGDKQDNRIDNLELFHRNSDHLRHELKGRCPKWTPEGLERLRQAQLKAANNRIQSKLNG